MSLPVDILKNILSDYIEYDQLQELVSHIPDLKIRAQRIKIFEISYDNLVISSRDTYIDNILRKIESWYPNGQKQMECQYREVYKLFHVVKDGKQYHWTENGNLKSEENYKDGFKDGEQYYWNGESKYTEIYKEGILICKI